MSTSRVVAVAGAKGGVGKTTTSINLAAAAADMDLSVGLVEADLTMANVLDFLELPDDATLHDVLRGEARLDEVCRPTTHGFDVYPSGVDMAAYADLDLDELSEAVNTLRERYSLVLVDTGAGVSYENLTALSVADGAVLVSTPRVASIRDTCKTAELVERLGGTVYGLTLVRSGTGDTPDEARLASFLDERLLGHVPRDDAVPGSQDAGRPVVESARNSPAARAYRDIAEALVRVLSSDVANDRRAAARQRTERMDVQSFRYVENGSIDSD